MSNAREAGQSTPQGGQGAATLQQGGVNASRVAYVKKLTLSDACTSKQIKLPRSAAETFIPALADKETSTLDMVDEDERPWSFSCTRYNCQYALSKIGAFAQAHCLGPDIYMIFYFDDTDALRVASRWTLPATLKDGLYVEKPPPNGTGRPAYGRGKSAGRPPGGARGGAAAAAAAVRSASPTPAQDQDQPAAAHGMGAAQGVPFMHPHHALGMAAHGPGLPMHGASMHMYAPGMPGWCMAWPPAQHGQQPSSGPRRTRQATGPPVVHQSPGFFSPSPVRARGEAGPSAFHVPASRLPSSQSRQQQQQQEQQAASPQQPPSSQPRKRSSLAADMDKENASPSINRAAKVHVVPPSEVKPSPHPLPAAPPDAATSAPISLWVGPQGSLPHPALTPLQHATSAAAMQARATALSMSAHPALGAPQPQPSHTPFQTMPAMCLNALSEPHAGPMPRHLSPWEAARQLHPAPEPSPAAAQQLPGSDSEGGSSEDARAEAAETLTLLSSGLDPRTREQRKTAAHPKPATARTGDRGPKSAPSRRPSSSRPLDHSHHPPPHAEQEDRPGPHAAHLGWRPPCSPRRDIFEGLEHEGRAAPAVGAEAPPSASRRPATPRAGPSPCVAPELPQHQPQAPRFQLPYPHLLMAHQGRMQHAWRQAQMAQSMGMGMGQHDAGQGFVPGMGLHMLPMPRTHPGLYWSPGGIGLHAAAVQQQQQQQQQQQAGHGGYSHRHEFADAAGDP